MVICLERGADLHTAQLMPLPLTASCFSKIQIGFTFLVPAHPGSPGKGPLNARMCVYPVPSMFALPCRPSLPTFTLLRPYWGLIMFPQTPFELSYLYFPFCNHKRVKLLTNSDCAVVSVKTLSRNLVCSLGWNVHGMMTYWPASNRL